MLMPKRVKRRKQFRGSMAGKANRGTTITYGEYGIVATEPCWIKSNQIEAARIAMTRYIKRGGQVFIKIFPDKPVSAKPAETRMGSGKGALEYWVAVVKPGRVLFEIGGVDEATAKEALRLATHKLPLKCKIVSKADLEAVITVKINKYVEELNAKSSAELNEELVAAKKELFNLRFQNATNQLDNTSRIKEVRKNIARIQTVLAAKAN